MPFAYIANIIVHEMIHQFTIENGHELEVKGNAMKQKSIYDPHENEFLTMMNDINEKHGLSITVACNLNNLSTEFDKSVSSIRRMTETENTAKM